MFVLVIGRGRDESAEGRAAWLWTPTYVGVTA
ncbi:hypothetical protein FHS94_000828 [Sphingomonas aerophila]|uniref:Uncharacterized protein n=1 Tax=Sphingomonas aerophila TaxID=1344948 RepID=A0A7W9ETB8_9SPHN|nr:hypothetical protein [Sphingomonas aerophila]